jgi:hypothetical protein
MNPNLPETAWHLSLGVSEIIGLVGLVFGLVGVGFAIQQNRKAKSADIAVAEFRSKLFKQRVAQQFSDIAPKAVALAGQIRAKDWPGCAELATTAGAGLSNATGFCARLITEDERESLELAASSLEYILEALPVDGQQLEAGVVQEMTRKCMIIVYTLEKVAGRLKSLDEWEE